MAKKKTSKKVKPAYAIQLWQGVDKQWYWHFISTVNGEIILSSEGYTRKEKAKQTIEKFVVRLVSGGILYQELDMVS